MQYYLIKPRDPLIIRSSRPFEEISDAQAARFPPPSTVAGALRNIHARSTGKPLNEDLLMLSVTGPLAVKMPINGNAPSEENILVPKPADVQYVHDRKADTVVLARSKPAKPNSGEGCDLPNGLWPLLSDTAHQGKPVSGPNWWSFHDLLAWRRGDALSVQQIQQNGWTPADPDIRTHISVNNQSRQAESGKIFQTTGLTMWQRPSKAQPFPDERIGLLAGIDGDISLPLLNLGGERRLANIVSVPVWPARPDDLVDSIINSGAFTLTLLTPALFNGGWLPHWLDQETLMGTPPCCQTLQVRLRAAALERWLPQSGWDLAKRRPRAAQKMIPAGATYWFDIVGEAPDADIEALWFAHVCDEEQHNRNGFGLALPAADSVNS